MPITRAELKNLRSLKRKKNRQEQNRFICEGVRLLEEAAKAEYFPEAVFYAKSGLSERGERLVERFKSKRVSVQALSRMDIDRIISAKSSQGIAALFEKRKFNLKQQLEQGYRKVLVCDVINDPGNLGTLLRSAAAFDFSMVIGTKNSAEITNPKAIRASAGAIFRIPYAGDVDDIELLSYLKANKYSIVYADIGGMEISKSTEAFGKFALVIGAEASGGGDTLMKNADIVVKIPMAENVESLNAAMAGTALMFWQEIMERREK